MLAASLLGAQTLAPAEPTVVVKGRPNFVLIVVDDAGFTDFGAFGSEVQTPNIDQLAARGVRFTNFHASPMCSPSRAMLLTGVDAHTAGVASLYEATPLRHRGKPGYEGQLRSNVTTIATRLSGAGYRTYLSGKWNLGHTPANLPSARGFDRTFALDATGADNFEKKPYLPIYAEVPWFADGKPTELPDDFYSSEFLVDKMIEFLKEDQGPEELDEAASPFFAYLAFQAIHIPVQAPRQFIERYEGVYDRGWGWLRAERHRRAIEKGVFPADAAPAELPAQRDWDALPKEEKALFAKSMAVQAGMLEAMDHHLGRLISYLELTGEYENTVFIVLSDNGPEAGDPMAGGRTFKRWLDSAGYRRDLETLGEKGSYAFIGPDFASATAAPLAYYKFHGGEGGVRVPLVIAGPGVAASAENEAEPAVPGRTTAAFSFITDIAPTMLDLAGLDHALSSGSSDHTSGEPMVGRSLAAVLADKAARVHPESEAVAFETAGHAAVWKGDHKLVRVGAPAGDGVWRLFDLAEDPGETEDLAAVLPERFAELMADYEAYAERVGVLELPGSYSPTRQLTINAIYDRLRDNLVSLSLAGIALLLVLFTLFRVAKRFFRGRQESTTEQRRPLGMKRRIVVALCALVLGIALVAASLPSILHAAGLHPSFDAVAPDLSGKRALIITTSHGVLNAPGETGGRKTGVFASEMTVPYYAFLDAGMQVDVASVLGGEIPIDPQSFLYMVRTEEDQRFKKDEDFQTKVKRSLRIDDVDFTGYDAVFVAGGWGAAYDLGYSEVLGEKISEAYYARTPIIGAVCHGALGLIRAEAEDGTLLVAGRRVTGVTDKQVEELGIDMTPMHPETELRRAGAVFEGKSAFRDVFANHVVVDDERRFVTGQNQNAGAETSHRMMALIAQGE